MRFPADEYQIRTTTSSQRGFHCGVPGIRRGGAGGRDHDSSTNSNTKRDLFHRSYENNHTRERRRGQNLEHYVAQDVTCVAMQGKPEYEEGNRRKDCVLLWELIRRTHLSHINGEGDALQMLYIKARDTIRGSQTE